MNKDRAQEIAIKKMDENGLRSGGAFWTFYFDDSVQRFGCCHHDTQSISLSAVLVELNDEETVTKTIVHEIAHALAGGHAGHNHQWKKIALSLGHNGARCYASSDVIEPPKPFKGTCPNCGKITFKHKRGKLACGKCCKEFNGGAYTHRFKIKWSRTDEKNT